jgi:hypothetical protein
MGFGNYSHAAHRALTKARADLPVQQVFAQTSCHALMNPKDVRARESRDSPDHPSSLAVAFALDVTGSMGEIPKQLAREELPKFMKVLVDCKVDDPQILFMAVGDATSDEAPLQVGQFESTAELMDRWLTWSFLEGRGGGQEHESYELALYFLAEHTDMDCWVKRQKHGYLFMTGDEMPYPAVSKHQVEALIGDRLDEDIPVAAVVAEVQKTFRPFFLIPDEKRRRRCERTWRDLLGDHVIAMEGPGDTCYVAAGLVALSEGVVKDLDAVARAVEAAGASQERVGAVIRALTPFAATLGADAVPPHRTEQAPLPAEDGASLWQRVKRALK